MTVQAGDRKVTNISGLDLLCDPNRSPTPDDIRTAVDAIDDLSICHDADGIDGVVPIEAGRSACGKWIAFQLVSSGLTFDLECLGEARAKAFAADHRFDLPDAFSPEGCKLLRLTPGQHLSGAERSLPVVRAQARIGAALAKELDGVTAIAWEPSAFISGKGFFEAAIAAWVAGGPFPAPGLITFRKAMGGALQSNGLAYFTGQELRVEGDLVELEDDALRLAARLVDQFVHRGAIAAAEQAMGPAGNALRIEPSTNGRYVRVWRA